MTVRALAYLGFESTDLDSWQSYATEILGLMKVETFDTDTIKFRMDSRAWRIAVEKGERDDIAYAGFEVTNAEAFAAMQARVGECGVHITLADPDMLVRRGVVNLFYFIDPTGIRIEVFYGPTEVFEVPFCSPAGVTGFVTGDQGIGHIVLLVPDARASMAFYEKTLGLQLTDIIDMPIPGGTVELLFMNCNARHHSLALGSMSSETKLEHFMLEVESIDDMGLAYDRVLKSKFQLRNGIGRHSNDHMISFYAKMPGGYAVEYGWGPRTIDRDWTVVRYNTASVWGHQRSLAN
ncbi:VOC family protein [Pseudomonas lini]